MFTFQKRNFFDIVILELLTYLTPTFNNIKLPSRKPIPQQAFNNQFEIPQLSTNRFENIPTNVRPHANPVVNKEQKTHV